MPPLSQLFPPDGHAETDAVWGALHDALPPLSIPFPPVPVPPKEPPHHPHPPVEQRRHLEEDALPPLSQLFPPQEVHEAALPLSQIFPPHMLHHEGKYAEDLPLSAIFPPHALHDAAEHGAALPLSQLFPPTAEALQFPPLSLPFPPSTDTELDEEVVQAIAPQSDCTCQVGHVTADCCVVPPPLCTPGKKKCNLPPWAPLPAVCGCDGVTYVNACVAALENCVRCFKPGFCPTTAPPTATAT